MTTGALQGPTALKGFIPGEETVRTVLTPPQVQMTTVGGSTVSCIGCHTSTPDGNYVGFTAQWQWGNALASISSGSVGQAPPFLGAGAKAALAQINLGIQTFSKAHFSAGDHIEIAPLGSGAATQLAWIDLEATSAGMGTAYGVLPRTGDPRGAGSPAWSHDGNAVVYVSTNAEKDGRLGVGDADLYRVPYGGKSGGAATPIAGASDPNYQEYYPSLSPDDSLIAFDRIANGNDMYNQPLAELFVVPAKGGAPIRALANDPPACSSKKSPGVTNSWPKWSPEALTVGSETYYWLIFSSTRGAGANPQLYLTAVVVSTVGEQYQVETFPAIYLWNQVATENNHTPAWDVFQLAIQ